MTKQTVFVVLNSPIERIGGTLEIFAFSTKALASAYLDHPTRPGYPMPYCHVTVDEWSAE